VSKYQLGRWETGKVGNWKQVTGEERRMGGLVFLSRDKGGGNGEEG